MEFDKTKGPRQAHPEQAAAEEPTLKPPRLSAGAEPVKAFTNLDTRGAHLVLRGNFDAVDCAASSFREVTANEPGFLTSYRVTLGDRLETSIFLLTLEPTKALGPATLKGKLVRPDVYVTPFEQIFSPKILAKELTPIERPEDKVKIRLPTPQDINPAANPDSVDLQAVNTLRLWVATGMEGRRFIRGIDHVTQYLNKQRFQLTGHETEDVTISTKIENPRPTIAAIHKEFDLRRETVPAPPEGVFDKPVTVDLKLHLLRFDFTSSTFYFHN